MKKSSHLILFFLLVNTVVFGQSYSELTLLASETNHGGTARIMGIGGANVALGGDISNAASNPAGLGYIRTKHFTFSPNYANNTVDADYFNTETVGTSSTKLSMGNLGVVFAFPSTDPRSDFKGGAFAISYNQLRNFDETLTYEGVNNINSIRDSYVERANNNISVDEFEDFFASNTFFNDLELAYATNSFLPVIFFQEVGNPSNQTTDIFSYGTARFENVRQTGAVTRTGSVGEWDFAYGANFNDKIYVGASLGIQTFRFEQERKFTEEAVENRFEFNSLTFNETLDVRGTGVNLEVGVNYRVSNYFRIGFSATTPTLIAVNELYEANMENVLNSRDIQVSAGLVQIEIPPNSVDTIFTFFEGDTLYTDFSQGSYFANTPVLENSYNIRTPYRLEFGLAGFIGKKGFISADVEYVGYKSAKLSNSDVEVVDNDFDFDNEIIKLTTRNAFNFRVGGEYRLNKFMLRAGFAHYASSFKDATFEQGRNFLSGGFGYKQKKWFLDFALVKQLENEFFYAPYSFADNIDTPQAQATQSLTTGTLTFGLNF